MDFSEASMSVNNDAYSPPYNNIASLGKKNEGTLVKLLLPLWVYVHKVFNKHKVLPFIYIAFLYFIFLSAFIPQLCPKHP